METAETFDVDVPAVEDQEAAHNARVADAPAIIYLQWRDHDTDVGATWCEDRIYDDDIAYVPLSRAEKAEQNWSACGEANLDLLNQKHELTRQNYFLSERLRRICKIAPALERYQAHLNYVEQNLIDEPGYCPLCAVDDLHQHIEETKAAIAAIREATFWLGDEGK